MIFVEKLDRKEYRVFPLLLYQIMHVMCVPSLAMELIQAYAPSDTPAAWNVQDLTAGRTYGGCKQNRHTALAVLDKSTEPTQDAVLAETSPADCQQQSDKGADHQEHCSG